MAYVTLTAKNKALQQGIHIMTSPFGMRKHPKTGLQTMHNGIDMIGKGYAGDTIVAFADGTVSEVGYNSSKGYYISIKHNDAESEYFHLKKDTTKVKKGDKVKSGQALATMGTTGSSTGVHLHFGFKVNGKYVDPLPYLEGKKSIVAQPEPSKSAAASPVKVQPQSFKKGDIVKFTGGSHYASSDAVNSTGGTRTAGTANVTNTAPGAKHPYHLIGVISNVWGWVDADKITKV